MFWKRLAVLANISVKEALKQLDVTAEKTLLVVDDAGFFLGTLTDGDIRRHLLRGLGLEENISQIYNHEAYFVKVGHFDVASLRNMMLELKISVAPIVDDHGLVVDVVLFDEVIDGAEPINRFLTGVIDVPIVIMAGGKGTRLAPFTQVLPKPLIPIGDKTILEIIIEGFESFGASQFFFTVNYRAAMIKAYFDSIERRIDITYLWEKKFCGTAGSLELLPADIADTFIVTNCDIIVKADYAEVLKFHKESKSDLTVIASIQHHVIPYGVVEYGEHGVVTRIKEKPEFSFSINTGVYVMNKSCLSLIPHGEVFHMTHMMEALIANGNKVVTYLVNEKDYIDIGQWEEYNKALDRMKGVI